MKMNITEERLDIVKTRFEPQTFHHVNDFQFFFEIELEQLIDINREL